MDEEFFQLMHDLDSAALELFEALLFSATNFLFPI